MDRFDGAEKALKLTAHITRVKQVSILHLFLASAITGAGLMLLWSLASDEEAHIDQFGSAIVSALSNQAVEPLIDRAIAIERGTLLADGPFREVLANAEVRASYLGEA